MPFKGISLPRRFKKETKVGIFEDKATLELHLCLECQNSGIVQFLSGAKLKRKTISFPSLESTAERQYCVFCRFVLGLVPEARAKGFKSWPCNSGYCLILEEKTVPGFRLLIGDTPLTGPMGHIYLVPRSPGKGGVSSVFNTRSLKILPHIDFFRMQNILRNCEDQHHGCRREIDINVTASSSREILLIDISEHRLVTSQWRTRYVALSYVWGGVDQLQTTRANFEILKDRYALLEHQQKIPQTIKDAIVFTKLLGERFLWVDTLCIIQDDPVQKNQQIAGMHLIYSNALVTIAAVSSKDASVGLPGLIEGSRPYGHFPVSNDHALAVLPGNPSDSLRYSEYESRGWTLQERVLSRRCLYVFDSEVMFHCQKEFSRENEMSFVPLPNNEDSQLNYLHWMTDFNPMYPLWKSVEAGDSPAIETARTYNRMVRLYTQRRLSFQSDIVDAFTGITSRIEQYVAGTTKCALPTGILEFALLWTKSNEDASSDERPELPRNKDFATWSWVGYVGPVVYDLSSSVLDLLGYDDGYSLKVEFVLVSERRGLDFYNSTQPDLGNPSGSQQTIQSKSPSFVIPLTRNTLSLYVQATNASHFSISPGAPWRWYSYSQHGLYRSDILDSDGRVCGMLFDGDIDGNTAHTPDSSHQNYEFILVSRITPPSDEDLANDDYLELTRDDWRNPKLELHVEAEQWAGYSADILVVMLIGWKNEFAERAGVGFMSKASWSRTNPIRKFVHLI